MHISKRERHCLLEFVGSCTQRWGSYVDFVGGYLFNAMGSRSEGSKARGYDQSMHVENSLLYRGIFLEANNEV